MPFQGGNGGNTINAFTTVRVPKGTPIAANTARRLEQVQLFRPRGRSGTAFWPHSSLPIRVDTSSRARELFTRLDTGRRWSRSFAAGLQQFQARSPFGQGSKSSLARGDRRPVVHLGN